MAAKEKQSFLHGALILMSATIFVKIVGYFFKVPLKGIIGVSGFGYFNAAYGLFNTLYALSVAGLPVAVSKMVAENMAAGRYRDVKKIRRISTLAFFCTGLAGTVVMALAAKPYVTFAQNPNALPAVLIMSPAIFFVCINSSFRGYYEGQRNMYPTALSQMTEAAAKLVCGLFLANAAVQAGLDEYARQGTVFGVAAQDLKQAELLALPFGAAGAILGIVLSTVAGSVFLLVFRRVHRGEITQEMLDTAPKATSGKVLLKKLWSIAVPVCLGGLVLNLTTLVDVGTLTNRLSTALSNGSETVLEMYRGVISKDTPLAEIPNYLFGAYNMSVTLYNLIPALTTTFGVSALPAVAAAWIKGEKNRLRENIESVWRVTSMIAFPAGFGLAALAEPILTAVYGADPASVPIAAPILRVLGVAAIFVALATPTNSMLQAVGRTDLPVKLMLVGGLLKLTINFTLVPRPDMNIQAAPYGTAVCYGFIVCVSVPLLCRYTGVRMRFSKVFLKPMFSGAMCAASAWCAFRWISRLTGGTVAVLLAIGIGACVYLICLFFSRGIEKTDIYMLPKGEKIAKLLEKYGLIR